MYGFHFIPALELSPKQGRPIMCIHSKNGFPGFPDTADNLNFPQKDWPNITYLAIWIFGKVRQTWPSGVSLKRAQKMQLSNVDLRSVGHSHQKSSPKINFWDFHHVVYPLEHLKPISTHENSIEWKNKND